MKKNSVLNGKTRIKISGPAFLLGSFSRTTLSGKRATSERKPASNASPRMAIPLKAISIPFSGGGLIFEGLRNA
jgi:hypothetical protein